MEVIKLLFLVGRQERGADVCNPEHNVTLDCPLTSDLIKACFGVLVLRVSDARKVKDLLHTCANKQDQNSTHLEWNSIITLQLVDLVKHLVMSSR